jgi:hypothetical protein
VIPDFRQDVESGHVRQHQVEDEEGDSVAERGVNRLGSGAGAQRPIAGGREMLCHQGNDFGLIVNDEDSIRYWVRFHCHTVERYSGRSMIVSVPGAFLVARFAGPA